MNRNWNLWVGELFRKARGNRTLEEFAHFLGFTKSTYDRIEKGQKTIQSGPLLEALYRLGYAPCERLGQGCQHRPTRARR